MAQERAPHFDNADLLDRSEYPISLLCDDPDMTETYRACVEQISEKYNCLNALDAFHSD